MVDTNNTVRPVPPDQISPKAVVLRIINIKNSLVRNWKLILAFVLIGGIIGFIADYLTPKRTVYTAILTFNLGGAGSSGPSFGELGALAGAFGLSGGAPDANIFTGDNFLVYSRSRPVIEKTLLKEVTVGKKKNLLVNDYIEHSGIRDKEWEENDTLRNIRFSRKPVKDFTLLENVAMGQAFERIKGEISVYQPDRKSSFIELRVGMEQEMLAKNFAERLLETIEEDYKVKQTKKTSEMLSILTHRAESLAKLLNRTEGNLARYIDQNQNMVIAEGQIQQTRLSRNSTFLQSQYLGALQQVDNMRLSIVKEAPLFTIIEPVYLPLVREGSNPRGTAAGLTLGLLLGVIIVFVRETYRSIMREE